MIDDSMADPRKAGLLRRETRIMQTFGTKTISDGGKSSVATFLVYGEHVQGIFMHIRGD